MSLIILIAGLAALPAYFTYEAFSDKASLAKAMRYAYAPDYNQDFIFKGSVPSVKRTLIRLKEFKEGIQLPILSDFYKTIVFENMVLPDKKIEEMYRFFTGEDIQKAALKKTWGPRSLGREPRGARARRAVVDQQVDLDAVDVRNEEGGGLVKSQVRLEMRNKGKSDRAEFLKDMHIPRGVLITGFKLKVNDAIVAGQIFEKRAALWVYHMIRDFTRRDPGILAYTSPTQVNLNVYPFGPQETRIAEIEFQFPQGQSPVISLGERQILLGQKQGITPKSPSAIIAKTRQHGAIAILPQEIMSQLPRFKRQPYLHFILDYSIKGGLDAAGYRQRIQLVKEHYPHVTMAKITAAHFNLEDLTAFPVPIASIDGMLAHITLAHQGALDIQRVIRQELWGSLAQGGINWRAYPLFVVITKEATSVIPPSTQDMAFVSALLPDCNYYLMTAVGNNIEKHVLWPASKEPEDKEVIALKLGKEVAILPADNESLQTVFLKAEGEAQELSAYEPQKSAFMVLPNTKVLAEDLPYAQGLELMHKNEKALANPAAFERDLPALVKSSRDLGVMIPATSYIVVERSSQWKTLALKEHERLKASQGLEFEEDFNTPAPALWPIVMGFVVLFWFRKIKPVVTQRRIRAP